MHVLYVGQQEIIKANHHYLYEVGDNQSKCKIYKVPAKTFYHMTYSTNHFVRTV